MTAEAKRILEVFNLRGLRAGEMIHPAEFGDAIVWDGGFVRDEPVRLALAYLFEEGFLLEANNALVLTEKGENASRDSAQPKHGARVYRVGAKILIKQTVLRGTPPEYVVDDQRERHVSEGDDAAIAGAIRAAVNGQL